MESKIMPLYPGIDVKEICAARVRQKHDLTTIIYPFRAQKYTGFRAFTDHLASVWEKRQDFRVVLTNPSNYDFIKSYPRRLPFLEVGRYSRREYLRELWKADIVAGCHNGASQWSLAAAEAVAAECIPLFNSESFFPEMLSAAFPNGLPEGVADHYLYYRQEFTRRLEYLLDNIATERARVRPVAEGVREYFDWDARVDDWIRCFETADQASPQLREQTEITRRIDRLLADRGTMGKHDLMRELRWHVKSRHISWTRYRRYLRACYAEDWRSPFATFSVKRGALTHPHRHLNA
jgi:hypothetical protein